MKCRSLYILVGLIAVCCVPVWADSCGSATDFEELYTLGSCTAGPGGEITFTNFHTDVQSSLWSNITVADDSGTSGYGFTFNTSQLTRTPSLLISYDATCTGCVISGAVQSATLSAAGGAGQFTIAGTANNFTANATFATSFAGTNFVTNFGTYDGMDPSNQDIMTFLQTLQLDIDPSPTTTPEPMSDILIGSGLVLIGLAARKRFTGRAR
jgi:hypothetical protein